MRRLASFRFVAVVAVVALAAFASEAAAVPRRAVRLNREANRFYGETKWPEAASLYDEAQAQAPESPEIAYNLGNALYRQGKMGDAAAHLRRAAESPDPVMKEKSLYNLGNALHDLGELQLAAKAYREALRLDPRDHDAKINYEKTMQELQKSGGKKDQQQQNKSQQKQDQGQKGQNQQQDDQGQGQNSEEQQSSQGQQQQGGEDSRQADSETPQQDPGSGAEPQPPQPGEESEQMAAVDSVPGGLTREEALRILEAMREQEKELQQQRARKVQARSRRVDKDW